MEPLSSAAVVISSLIVTKAFEKTGEKLGEVFVDKIGKFVSLIKSKALPKTKAVNDTSGFANFTEAVNELESTAQSDAELSQAVRELNQAVESDPTLMEKIRNTAVLVKNEPNLIQNQAKLAEKIGLVVQGGTVNIENLNF